MKALSIKQPWAWLIVNGYKDIENRTWPTNFRGPFMVHAGKGFHDAGYAWVKKHFPKIPLPKKEEFQRGGIVGKATITGCVTTSPSKWYHRGDYGFVIANGKRMRFRTVKGRRQFFTPEVDDAG